MVDERPHCDHQVDVDDCTWFECELPMHHPGDHQYLYTWPNEPQGPKLPPTPNRFLSAMWAEPLQTAYSKMLGQQLVAAVHGSPFVNPDTAVRQVVNRDRA